MLLDTSALFAIFESDPTLRETSSRLRTPFPLLRDAQDLLHSTGGCPRLHQTGEDPVKCDVTLEELAGQARCTCVIFFDLGTAAGWLQQHHHLTEAVRLLETIGDEPAWGTVITARSLISKASTFGPYEGALEQLDHRCTELMSSAIGHFAAWRAGDQTELLRIVTAMVAPGAGALRDHYMAGGTSASALADPHTGQWAAAKIAQVDRANVARGPVDCVVVSSSDPLGAPWTTDWLLRVLELAFEGRRQYSWFVANLPSQVWVPLSRAYDLEVEVLGAPLSPAALDAFAEAASSGGSWPELYDLAQAMV